MKTELVQSLCEISGHATCDHFADVGETIAMLKGSVRKTLLERGIRPESLPAAEDVKKIDRLVHSDDKKAPNKPDALDR